MTGGERAGFFIVLAWAGEEQASFLVERETCRLEIVRTPDLHARPVRLQARRARAQGLSGSEGARLGSGGDEGNKRWFSLVRLMIAARCCGAAERLIDLARSWSLERSASGRKLAEYQAIQFMLADSLTELNAARLMTSPCSPFVGDGRLQDPARQDGDGEAVHLRDGRPRRGPGGPDLRRSRVHDREPRRALLPRAQGRPHLGGTSEIQRTIVARGLLEAGSRSLHDGRVGRSTFPRREEWCVATTISLYIR